MELEIKIFEFKDFEFKDFCLAFPAMSAVTAGYDVRLVMDCSGLVDEYVRQITIAQLTQAGVRLASWVAVACEMMGD